METAPKIKSPLINAIWKFKCPKKVKIFLWSIAHKDKQQMLQRFKNSVLLPYAACYLCLRNVENLDHMFFRAPSLPRGGLLL